MPLVRFEVRNEYGLGSPELCKAKNFGDHDVRKKKKENESKEILDGVAVAGLVGILRQLGDLAQLASDIFHDLHEQVMVTSARGRKLSNRIRNLEAEVPLVENAVKGQRSHIHYAYAAGCDYYANLQFEQSHLLSTDLPQYMMDFYEESRDPPRLYLLDKFDTNGSGACLKRYSNPSYFRTVWSASELEKAVKVQRERKGHKIKRKGSELNQESRLGSSLSQHFSSARFAYSNADEHHFSTDTSPLSTSRHNKPDLESRPSSFDSRRLRFVEPVVDSNSSGLPDESEINSPCISKSHIIQGSAFASDMHDTANVIRMYPSPPPVRWDEKSEILKPVSPVSCDDIPMDDTQFKLTQMSSDNSDIESDISEMEIPGNEITSETEKYMDASTILESETETDSEYQAKREFKSAENTSKNMDYFVGSEDPLMPSHSYTSPIQDPEEIAVNQNDNHDNVPNETACDSHERSEMFNADIVKGHRCFVNGNKCKEKSYQLVMPEEGSEPAMPPCVTRSDQHPNYRVSSQIKNENSFGFEAVDDKPTFAGIHSKPINQISDSSSVKVEAAINRPPGSNISNSTTIFEFSANDSYSTTSPPVYTSNIPSPKLWTNGILLGLAPSKPPVFSAMNESNEVSASNTCTENSPNKTRSWNSSHTENTNDGKSNYVEQNIPQNGFTKNLTESMPSESGQSTDDIKSSLASLAQRILANGLQRKQSIAQIPSEDVVRDFNRPPDNKAESDACFPEENVSFDMTMQLNSQFSGNSSPPLEHMKISFHPMNGSEVSNLKLEYATEDLTFPSFQLLPKSNNHLADHDSETDDDDTFCRSGHYTSEDHESNSEMWEQDDMTVYSNCDADNDLDRSSLSNSSVSSFKGFFQGGRRKTAYEFGYLEVENGMQYPQNNNSLNIPGLDSFVLTSKSQHELPPPPPLPPMQWRTSKGSSDKKEEKDFSVAEIVEHFNDIFNDMHPQRFIVDERHEQNIPMSPPRTMHNVRMLNEHGETNGNDVSSKQLTLEEELSHKFDNQHNVQMWNEYGQTNGNDVSSKQTQLEEALSHKFDNQHENQKISGHTQPSYISGGQVVGEREDFLLQIRNKSFKLRRTSTTKSPSSVPQSTANINVAAILEKATAIRQAVVDSDGEDDDDDNWSDS